MILSTSQFSGSLIPSIADATSRAAADQVGAKAAQVIQKELNKTLPHHWREGDDERGSRGRAQR